MAYSQEDKDRLFDEVCLQIQSGKAVRNVLKVEGMPDVTTFYRWLDEDESKSKQYARACELRAEHMFEDILDIADDSSQDTITDEEGNDRFNSEFAARSRIRIDARKWLLSKLNPKKYGDKTDITTNGNDVTTLQVFKIGDTEIII